MLFRSWAFPLPAATDAVILTVFGYLDFGLAEAMHRVGLGRYAGPTRKFALAVPLVPLVLAFWGGRVGAATLGPELGIFVGSLTAGMASNLYGRTQRRPSVIALVPALLLLVPGSVGFRSLVLMMRSDIVIGVEAAFRMAIMLSALVAGLLIANVVLPAGPRR